MKNNVTREEVDERWTALRNRINNVVYPKEVAAFLSKPESDLTKQKILATLKEMANYRLESPSGWVNEGDSAQGDIVICEGLETFFAPAVEGSVSFQEFLEVYNENGQEFLKTIQEDLSSLLDRWNKKGFEGTPYIKGSPNKALRQEYFDQGIGLVESACFAIRVILHFYTLVLRSRGKETRFAEFFEPYLRSQKVKFQKVFTKALMLIVQAFQKGKDGKIGTSEIDGVQGSGWSGANSRGFHPCYTLLSVPWMHLRKWISI